MSLNEFLNVPGCIIAYQSNISIHKKSFRQLYYPQNYLPDYVHYFMNFIEPDRIKIVIINPDAPLLADGRKFSVGGDDDPFANENLVTRNQIPHL